MSEERENRLWYYVGDDFTVQDVRGYTCAPNNPEYWWCPEVGVSAMVGHHLFETQEEAVKKAIDLARTAAEKINAQITLLEGGAK